MIEYFSFARGFVLAGCVLLGITSAWAQTSTTEGPVETVGVSSFVPMEPQDRYQQLINQALADFEKEKYDAALAVMQQAQEMFPRDPFALNLVGSVHTKQKNWEQAGRYFNRALNEDPSFFPARFNLGEILFLQGKKEEALEYFENLNQMFPENGLIQFKLVTLFLLTDRKADAQRLADRIPVVRDSPAWYFARAALAQSAGDRGTAREHLRAAQDIFPEEATAIFLESLEDSGLKP